MKLFIPHGIMEFTTPSVSLAR